MGVALGSLAATAMAADPALRKMVEDSDSAVRADAADRLGKEGTVAAAKLLRRLVKDEVPNVRDWAVWSCEGLKDEKAAAELLPLTRDRDALVRLNGHSALARARAPQLLEVLDKVVREDKSALVRESAVAWLGSLPDPAAVRQLAFHALKDEAPEVRAAGLMTLDEHKLPEVVAAVEAACGDPDEGVRCTARSTLRLLDPERGAARLGTYHPGDGWRARVQTVEDASRLRGVSSVEALIGLLQYPHVRVAGEALEVLQRLTRKEYGPDPEVWRGWWEQNRAGWKAPSGRLEPLGTGKDKERTTARYHGIEVRTECVVFALDFSGSMTEDTRGGEKWLVAAAHLEETLAALPDGVRVNLVLFADEVTTVFDEPRALDAKSRKALATFLLRSSNPSGGTNVLGAIETTLAMDDVDTLFLLTDGSPTAGDVVFSARVRPRVTRANRRRKIAIHTVAFGASDNARAFMKRLASANGGRYVAR